MAKVVAGVSEVDGKQVIQLNLNKDFRKIKTILMEEFSKQGKADLVDIRLAPKVGFAGFSLLRLKEEISRICQKSREWWLSPAAKAELGNPPLPSTWHSHSRRFSDRYLVPGKESRNLRCRHPRAKHSNASSQGKGLPGGSSGQPSDDSTNRVRRCEGKPLLTRQCLTATQAGSNEQSCEA